MEEIICRIQTGSQWGRNSEDFDPRGSVGRGEIFARYGFELVVIRYTSYII